MKEYKNPCRQWYSLLVELKVRRIFIQGLHDLCSKMFFKIQIVRILHSTPILHFTAISWRRIEMLFCQMKYMVQNWNSKLTSASIKFAKPYMQRRRTCHTENDNQGTRYAKIESQHWTMHKKPKLASIWMPLACNFWSAYVTQIAWEPKLGDRLLTQQIIRQCGAVTGVELDTLHHLHWLP